MTPQIKQRIEKIKNGQVPEGYKKTDIGIIPVDWNQTKLGLIASHVLEKNIHSDFKTTFTNSATKGVIKQTDFFDKNISNDENISGYYIVQENDYIYNPRISVSAPCGPINQSHFSEKGIVSPLYIVFKMNGDMGKSKYIESFFCSSLWHRYICEIANYGARHDRMNITNKDFFNMPIPLPPSDEQKKIAEILAMQDKIIELKERKIEELKKLKIYYLSKMFPKKGSNYPEVRFPGFTAPWEQRMLGEVFRIRDEKNCKKFKREDVLAVSDAYGCVNQIAFHGRSFAGEDISNYKIVKTGDIVYTKSPLQAKPYGIIKIVGKETGIVSPLYIVNEVKHGFDPMFMYYLFDTPERTNNYLSLLVRKGAKNTMNISNKEWLSGIVTIAPSEEEQKAIAKCFYSFDQIIALHQRELDEEKKLKKSLMQLLLSGLVRV